MKCPKCQRRLKEDAIRCLCGWTELGTVKHTSVPCAHEACHQPALVRFKVDTGWANLCELHYAYHAGLQIAKPKPAPKLNAHCQAIRDAYLRKGEVKPMSEYVEKVEA